MKQWSIWVGFDPREATAFATAVASIRRRLTAPIPVHGVVLSRLRDVGLYRRPTSTRAGQLWDDISAAPCSTEFAISRFLVPQLAGSGLALFMDCDVLVRAKVTELFDWIETRPDQKAVWCVHHAHVPSADRKMGGLAQTQYVRKNWSSVMMFDLTHPASRLLTVEMVNTLPGRDLHRFCWLRDDDIGELPPEWNHLVGEMPPNPAAKIAHFTSGIPSIPGYEGSEFADEWRAELTRWAA